MIHHLKIYPEHFSAVCTGIKRAELRKNDRDFKVGDTLHLMETPKGSCNPTGEFINTVVTHIADVGEWLPGYVMLSIERESGYAAPQLPQPAVMDDEQSKRLFDEWSGGDAALGELRENGVPDEFISMLKDFSLATWEACREAMLKHSAPFIVTSDHRMMEMPKVEGIDAVADMLQGAEPVQSNTLRDGLAAIRRLGGIDAGKIQAERDALNEPTCWCLACHPVTMNDARFVVCPDCGNKRCPRANDHRNACTGSNEPGQEGSAYPAAPHQEEPNRIHEERVKIQEEMAMGARLTKHRFKVK